MRAARNRLCAFYAPQALKPGLLLCPIDKQKNACSFANGPCKVCPAAEVAGGTSQPACKALRDLLDWPPSVPMALGVSTAKANWVLLLQRYKDDFPDLDYRCEAVVCSCALHCLHVTA